MSLVSLWETKLFCLTTSRQATVSAPSLDAAACRLVVKRSIAVASQADRPPDREMQFGLDRTSPKFGETGDGREDRYRNTIRRGVDRRTPNLCEAEATRTFADG